MSEFTCFCAALYRAVYSPYCLLFSSVHWSSLLPNQLQIRCPAFGFRTLIDVFLPRLIRPWISQPSIPHHEREIRQLVVSFRVLGHPSVHGRAPGLARGNTWLSYQLSGMVWCCWWWWAVVRAAAAWQARIHRHQETREVACVKTPGEGARQRTKCSGPPRNHVGSPSNLLAL